MKLLNVFALVLGAHLAVFTVIFATPGCRSTGKPKPKPEDTQTAGEAGGAIAPADTLAPVPVMNDADLNPGANTAPITRVNSVSPVVALPGEPAGAVRFAPTRPTGANPAPVVEHTSARATHTVAKGDNLWSLAKKYGVTVSELSAANQLAPSATLRLGQQLTVPAKPTAMASGANAGTDAANTYEVMSGDTLGAIARKQGTTVAALRTANNLSGDALRIGQKLVVPGNALPVAPSAGAHGPAAVAPAPKAGSGTHSVVPGDTLGSIARKHGVKVGDLATLNTITDPAKLRVGQVLRLPAGAKTVSAPPTNLSTSSSPGVAETAPVLPVQPPEEAAAPVPPAAVPAPVVESMPVPVIRID